jgi:hypothetical protein
MSIPVPDRLLSVPVPEGLLTIAQRFIAGKADAWQTSCPVGTVEGRGIDWCSSVPPGRRFSTGLFTQR